MMRAISLGWAVAVGLAMLAAPARADFLYGKQLSAQVYFPDLNTGTTPVIFTANGTNAVNLSGGNIVNVDLIVSDTTIEFIYKQPAFFNAASFNGYVIKAISPDIPAFTSFTVDPATTMAGFTNSRLSYTANTLNINVQGLSSSVGTILKLDLVVAPNAVPEPASLAMAGVGGLAVVAASVRSRRKTVAAR